MYSAAARKATIANKDISRRQLGQKNVPMKGPGSRRKSKSKHKQHEDDGLGLAEAEAEFSQSPLMFFLRLFDEKGMYQTAVQASTMAQKSFRTLLWDAVTSNTLLFQAGLFVSGTHSNTCGISAEALNHMGTGLILLRGASLGAIQASILASGSDSMTTTAIAMLAGWEQRFGDRQSYAVHMAAWNRMSLSSKALEENNVATLVDTTLETFRENLNDRSLSIINTHGSLMRSHRPQYHDALPPGFRVFSLGRPEALSLLNIVAHIGLSDPNAADAVPYIRKLCIENMAWGLSHTLSMKAYTPYEEEWDKAEAKALYHIRAGCVSINGILLQTALDAHKVPWTMDLAAGLEVHTVACQHLNTEELMGTKYQEIAIWSRFVMCAISRDPERDDQLKRWLRRLEIQNWSQLEAMLERLLYPKALIGSMTETLYRQLMTVHD